MAAHGHLKVNGTRVTIPSYLLNAGDVVTIREASLKKGTFTALDEKLKSVAVPSWIKFDPATKKAEIQGLPHPDTTVPFSLAAIIEFYSR